MARQLRRAVFVGLVFALVNLTAARAGVRGACEYDGGGHCIDYYCAVNGGGCIPVEGPDCLCSLGSPNSRY
jgi:hypothetical protein